MPRKLISQMHPWLYTAAVKYRQTKRKWNNRTQQFARHHIHAPLAHRCYAHESLLIRKLGVSDPKLQYNKVTNLKIAASCINEIVIKPGETFSLWECVGEPTAKRGFLDGMLLSNSQVSAGVGGGLCQMANLLYWMALHTPMAVTERHHHSFDAFPDQGRTLPFGSGATIFYNYFDLQIKNTTDKIFQIRVWLDETHLRGEIRSDQPLEFGYHVYETGHHFLLNETDGQFYRTNTLWRSLYHRTSGVEYATEKICFNFSKMKYTPTEYQVCRMTLSKAASGSAIAVPKLAAT